MAAPAAAAGGQPLVAVVSGANKGIGLGIARALAKKGMKTVVTARKRAPWAR